MSVDDGHNQGRNIEGSARGIDDVSFVIGQFTLLKIVEILQFNGTEHRRDNRRNRDRGREKPDKHDHKQNASNRSLPSILNWITNCPITIQLKKEEEENIDQEICKQPASTAIAQRFNIDDVHRSTSDVTNI